METDKIASTHLGKKSSGSINYDYSLLVPILRDENRKQYQIDSEKLPFFGFDVWHAYEFSVLCNNGLPVTRLMKLKYSCESNYLVESKSLKLYLNSFNMTKFGNSVEECLDICKSLIEKDLSEILKTPVEVNFLENSSKRVEIFKDFENITNYVDENTLNITNYKEAPQVLKTELKESECYLMCDFLRSNCRVTHQPDFGDLYIYYKSQKHILENSLLEYICSFRSEYHFHEECVEMIYKRLSDLLDDNDKLMVCALYTRRGGIDICPVRSNFKFADMAKLIDVKTFARKGIKQ